MSHRVKQASLYPVFVLAGKQRFGGKDGLKTLFNHFPCRYRISIIGCHTQIAVKPPSQLLGFVEPCWIGERKQSLAHQPAESFVMFGAGGAGSCKKVAGLVNSLLDDGLKKVRRFHAADSSFMDIAA